MNNKYLAIVPARGGSKRLPRKNVLDFCGKPLISWSIDAAIESKCISNVLVTSDDDEVLDIARNKNINTIKRPIELASDNSAGIDAIIHAIENFEEHEYVVVLQPTSPLRTSIHIDESIKLLESKNAEAIISVCETEHSPLWCNTLSETNSMKDFLNKDLINTRSQDLPSYYRLNGAIFICKTKSLLKQKTFYIEDNIYAYKMKQEYSVDIDTKIDFLTAKVIKNELDSGI